MIQLQSVSLQRGSRQLLQDANLSIHAGDRVGLVGANGTGKSSLFQLLQGELQTESGECQIPKQWRIGHMQQEIGAFERSALDFVMDGDQALRQVQNAIAEHPGEDASLADLYTQLEDMDGYTAEARAGRLLSGLGFSAEEFSKTVASFSGGWRVRLALAQALMCPSDLLLLDEPTNHLDLAATLWLEQWLKSYPGTLVIVSHDRDFLDQVVTLVVHIENQKLNAYSGNYSGFETQRAERLAQQQQLFQTQQARIAEINDFVRRFKAKASKARQAQSRVKELERMELIAPAHADSPFHFQIPCADKIPQTLINLTQADLGYGKQAQLSELNLNLLSGSRVGLLGANGAGKSTLLKTLARDLPLMKGERTEGDGLRIGYFAQHQLQSLDLQASPALHLQRANPKASEQQVRTFLGGFDFRGDRAFEPITHFSGGEKARLTLALIAWAKPNLLILDEPTNHLDLEMRHALTVALQGFAGAIIVVSHDRHLLRNTVDELWLVADGTVEPFSGNLDDYEHWLADQSRTGIRPSAQSNSRNGDISGKKQSRQQSAQARAAIKPLTDRLKKFEKELEKQQDELAKLEVELAAPDIYEPANKTRLQELLQKQSKVQQWVAQAEEGWLSTQEELEKLAES